MARALFTPLRVGDITLQHRVSMAPLTRFRARKDHVHTDMAIEYYGQRASTAGTLLVSEATFIAPQAGGYAHVPGIWSQEQIAAWKKIVDEVHARGSFIYLQLWALGRAATASVLSAEPDGPFEVVSSSDIPLQNDGRVRSTATPRSLTEQEIKQYVEWYAQAARNFVEGAGGDGVEIHGANGYLIDQFTQSTCNKRTDKYGGSIENRTRFAREVVAAVAGAVGPRKTGIRLSPHSEFQGMKMPPADLDSTFSFLVQALKTDHPSLAYIHLTQPRVAGGFDQSASNGESLDFLLDIWAPNPVLLAGAYTAQSALADAEKYPNAVIAFGRHFISNPDLPARLKSGIALEPYNRKLFYTAGAEGYTTYKPAQEEQAKL